MLRQDKTKPHRIKWAEAERELAIREFAMFCWCKQPQRNPRQGLPWPRPSLYS